MTSLSETTYGGFISKLILNDSTELNIAKNDIVVFVGPNNAGKSQSLRDIYEISQNRINPIVISDIEIQKENTALSNLIENISSVYDRGNYKDYQGLNYSFNSFALDSFSNEKYYNNFRNIFVSYLTTENRLSICHPPQILNRNETKQHPIHYVAFNQDYRLKISKYFKKAFGKDLIPNTQFGSSIPLCIGEPIILNKETFDDEQSRLERYASELEKYPQVHMQGDGIKSFTGILLNLIISYHRTFLIDEPESFLHPPQAKIMGHTIGELLESNQQAFISTHSQEILQGLLEVCPNRVKIVRITRDNNTNQFSILDNEKITTVWKDSLLKHSDILKGIFHKKVVLCESDSDCRLYSIIHAFQCEQANTYAETLFIHCGGKQRMSKIVMALKALSIPISIIPDIDILNDSHIFRSLIENTGGSWEKFSQDLNILENNLTTNKNIIERNSFMGSIETIITSSTEKTLSDTEIKELRNLLKIESKWSLLKKGGIDSLPAGDGYNAFNRISKNLKDLSIYIVPVGELENFIKEIGGHGPDWVNKVLESYPDFSSSVYAKIKDFISTWNL